MDNSVIEERLKQYNVQTIENEQHALKEILQEIALYSLSIAGFFEHAVFHGGTALRILHDLPRFSEDLDFLLKRPDINFKWEPYFNTIVKTCKQYGVHPEVIDKSKVQNNVKKMFLKDDSIGKILDLSFIHQPKKKFIIKLEIDVNPPKGSNDEIKFLEFPLDFSIISQDLSSNFAGKCHAVLCRKYVKGRDWYDFSWYISKKIKPNLNFLKCALEQQGPWANKKIELSSSWLINTLRERVNNMDWQAVVKDTAPFLNKEDRNLLTLWGNEFFLNKIEKLDKLYNLETS